MSQSNKITISQLSKSESQSEMNIIIMAGGLGKRMKSELPKVLHKVNGIPMVVRVIQQAMELNPKYILLVVGKYRPIIKETLKEFKLEEDKDFTFIMQEPALGTGHAIQCCKPFLFINGKADDKVIVLSGDTPMIQSELIKSMTDFQDVKIMTTTRKDPTGYGRVKLSNGSFDKIVEHKDCNKQELLIDRVNCGMYAFKNELLWKYLGYLNNDNAQKEYYLTDMIEILKVHDAKIEILDLKVEDQWQLLNVNDKEQLRLLNTRFTQ